MLATRFASLVPAGAPASAEPEPVATFAASPDASTTVPPTTTPPTTVPDGTGATGGDDGLASNLWDVAAGVLDNLSENYYQTGTALIFATVAVIMMQNIKVHRAVLVPVAIGAFWGGWLLWNTFTNEENSLFPSNVNSAFRIWDVALSGGTGFIIAVGAGCVAALYLWRGSLKRGPRFALVASAVLGASFVYNLAESIRLTA